MVMFPSMFDMSTMLNICWNCFLGFWGRQFRTLLKFLPKSVFFKKCFFFSQKLYRIIPGTPKHILYLVCSVLGISTRVGISGSCGLCGCGWKSHPHYPHINICQKWQFFGPKWVSMALFSILSAQNIIIVNPSWFYPSSWIKK